MSISGEKKRKLVHVAMLGWALLLRPLAWWQTALVALLAVAYNGLLYRRLHGEDTFRENERGQAFSRGMLYYPLSVLCLITVFRDQLIVAGAAWAILALGDGFATIAGQTVGGARLPWSNHKSWAGSAAFVVAGALGALAMGFYLRRQTLAGIEVGLERLIAAALVAALFAALLESLELGVDDNLVVPAAAGFAFWLAVRADASALAGSGWWWRLAAGLTVSVATGALALAIRGVDARGFAVGVGIGTLVWSGAGLAGYATLFSFFVLGTLATRIGYREKAARGIAEARGGRRSSGSALAKGAVGAGAGLTGALVPELQPVTALLLAGAYATAAADTVSSEIGKRFGASAYLSTTFRRVAPGTEGAISAEGTSAGIVAAVAVASVACGLGLLGWNALPVVTVAAALGNHLESLAGRLLGAASELDNEVLNFLNTLAGAFLTLALARLSGVL